MAGLLAFAAVLVAWAGSPRRRMRRLAGRDRIVRLDLGWTAALLVPVLALLLFGPVAGVVAVAAVPAVRRQVAGLESAKDRRRAAAIIRQSPMALDLIAVVLAVGRSPHDAVRIVATSTPAPLGDELAIIAHRARLAADTVAAWRTLDGGPLEAMGRAFARSEVSGAAIVPIVKDTADDLRRRARAERREAVSRIGVRTTAPLGLCLLPAFVLMGIAPTVIAMVGRVL